LELGNEQLSMDGLLEAFGISKQEPAPATPPAPTEDPAPAEPENPPAPEAPQGEETSAPPAEGQQPEPAKPAAPEPQLESINKQAHAFAEMRTKINEQNKVLADIGKALGIQGKPEEILAGLQKITNAQKAKEAGVPPEIMERITALEAEKAVREENDRKIQTYAAINNFQRNMGLDQKQLNAFLVQLAQAGKNPFEQQVDLKAEYLVMNFDRLQQEAVQKALEAQAKLDNKANSQSTNPGTKTGGGGSKTTEVKSFEDLDAFLKANIK
jgi:hypothetical protein